MTDRLLWLLQFALFATLPVIPVLMVWELGHEPTVHYEYVNDEGGVWNVTKTEPPFPGFALVAYNGLWLLGQIGIGATIFCLRRIAVFQRDLATRLPPPEPPQSPSKSTP